MSTRLTLVLSLVSVLLALSLSLVFWPRLPDPMASHWNAAGEVDGYMPRFWGVALMPLVTLAMLGLFLLVPQIDPLRSNIQAFRPIYNLFIFFVILFLLYVHLLTLLWNVGYRLAIDRALPPALGLLFLLIAYLLRHARRNWFIGIRTPWTLSSDRVWEQTHRLGAVLFALCGLLSLLGAFFGGPSALFLSLTPLLLSTMFLIVYSWWLYRQQEQ
ncbi:MAG: SdpI family protein [Chloroflexi bacterium]|nr:SdpI family protein [Chloroflexota bacterium]